MCEVHDYLHYRKFLYDVFHERKARNAAYSLRAFARDLDVTASLLSKVFNEKDAMTFKTAEHLAEMLRLSEEDREFFMELVKAHRSGDYSLVHKVREMRQYKSVDLKLDEGYRLAFHDFPVFIKVSLHEKVGADLEWARELGLEAEELWQACERLAAAGFIEGNRTLGWTTQITHILGNDEQMAANREYHRQYLMRVAEAFLKPPTERHFYTSFRALSEKDFELFCQSLRELLNTFQLPGKVATKGDKAYLLGFQFFPFSFLAELPVGTVMVDEDPKGK